MYNVKPSSRFKRDLKVAQKRGYDVALLTQVIKILSAGEPLLEKYHDHPLQGNI